MEVEEKNTNRIFWLDAARAIAIISVTFNHALSRSFAVYSGTYDEYIRMPAAGSFIKALLFVFSRLGVPLFLMITGSLLMDRNFEDRKTTERFMKKNLWPLLRITLIWLTIMYGYFMLARSSYLRAEGIASALLHYASTILFINPTTMGSMWYMPMILCVYLMIPIMSLALKKLGTRYMTIPLVLVFVSAIIVPDISTILNILGRRVRLEMALSYSYLFTYYILYVFAGYGISKGLLSGLHDILLAGLFLVSLLGMSAFQFWTYSTGVDYATGYSETGVFLASVFLFELIRRNADRAAGQAARKRIGYLAEISFGIYFVHICIMHGLKLFLDRTTGLTGYPSFFILEAVSLGGSIALIAILSKSRLLARYLFGIRK